ncbi:hypothetical protein [Nocardia africana]|uniref:RsbT co-antagonist protein RsbRD N-terminal domain-containing protein n=1 Tax=Nocardia africana TaxID=134964 RepID=A0ABW6NKQ6_9NOCA
MPAYDSWDAESVEGDGFDSGKARSAPHSDPAIVIRMGFELALILLGDAPTGATRALRRLEHAAAVWARDGIPIDMVQHAIHDGVKLTLNRIDPAGGKGTTDPVADRSFLVDMLDLLTCTVSRAYVAEIRRHPAH